VIARGTTRRLACVGVLLTLAGACRSDSRDSPPPSAVAAPENPASLPRIPLPDLSNVQPQLRQRLEAQQAALDGLLRVGTASKGDLAQAFGDLGRLCLAADFPAAAVAAFQNARQLAPVEFQWVYYLGHASRLANDPASAREAWQAAVQMRPEDVPARIWLGRLLVDDGRPAEAVPHLEAVVRAGVPSAAARFELGRAALAQQRFADAAAHFEAALELQPDATGVHFPLAAAYRGMKNDSKAAEHARLWRQGDVAMADPLMDDAGSLLRTSLDFAVRGTRAFDARDWVQAAALFREGLRSAPGDAILHLNLGAALYMSGMPAAALGEFETAVRLSPGNARAHFNAGVVLEEAGRDAEAVARFATAVALDPALADARFSLANAQRRTGQIEQALTHYRAIVEADPSASQARFGLAMGLVRLGRYAEARSVLEAAVEAHPDQVGLTHALARLLAAAPVDAVRDAGRAVALVSELRRNFPESAALAETAAMAAAARGEFGEAVALQRSVIEESRRAGARDRLRVLEENLRRYEARQPPRQPWSDDDPVHQPRSAPDPATVAGR
jgi:tetratricopeptide (TPR) repeat protein